MLDRETPETTERPDGFTTALFRADSALIKELGERLVGQPHIALGELIKNSYDADATICEITFSDDEIIVSDNGHGMTKNEFLNNWMTIGTRNKQQLGQSRDLNRNLTGSKGVGRLAAQFLASELEMITTAKVGATQELFAKVDWEAAIEAESLTKAEALYKERAVSSTYPGGKTHGTKIVMRGMKQFWDEDSIKDLGKEIWTLQAPLPEYGQLSNDKTDTNDFRIILSSSDGVLEDTFHKQMSVALKNYDAIIIGEVSQKEGHNEASVRVQFSDGQVFSESFKVDPSIRKAQWKIGVFTLVGRQYGGITVQDFRDYLGKFGGVQVYDASFRLPYYGVLHDWLGIEYDHSHRKNKSSLLPARLHVNRALNDLPTQGRIYGFVQIDTGEEARGASEEAKKTGDFLKIQVTRDRLVSNKAYETLRDTVRWSLDYYSTRKRLREESKIDLKRPVEPSEEKVLRVRSVIESLRYNYPKDEDAQRLGKEFDDFANTVEEEHQYAEASRTLLSPLAAAGMAAIALEHESKKELRLGRRHAKKLITISKELDDERLHTISADISNWIDRLESTRRLFAPMLNAEDREEIEAFSANAMLNQVCQNVAPLIRGVNFSFSVPKEIMLPHGTFAEWNALFQNILINAANATLDKPERNINISGTHSLKNSRVLISDNGHGIDWRNSDKYFEPFKRDAVVSDERKGLGLGGMGLGLTIVRMVADQRNCKARFIKPEEGWSTTFELFWRH